MEEENNLPDPIDLLKALADEGYTGEEVKDILCHGLLTLGVINVSGDEEETEDGETIIGIEASNPRLEGKIRLELTYWK